MTSLNPLSADPRHLASSAAVHRIAGYDVLRTLGTGAGSTLYQVNDRHGATYALKHVAINHKGQRRFADQAQAEHAHAQRFDDPRIRKSHRVHKLRNVLRLSGVAVVMEYIDGTTLDNLLPHDAVQLCEVFREIASALDVMHQAGFVHADLKPANIMVARTQGAPASGLKLIDFGQSCAMHTVKERIQGTPDYMAPEQAKRRPLDARTDVYCLAATIYQLLTGEKASRALVKRSEVGAPTDAPGQRRPAHELNPQVSPALSALLSQCLATKPQDRPDGMPQVMDRLDLAIQQTRRAG